MRAYFEQFGTVTDCVVMKDPTQPQDMKRNRWMHVFKRISVVISAYYVQL